MKCGIACVMACVAAVAVAGGCKRNTPAPVVDGSAFTGGTALDGSQGEQFPDGSGGALGYEALPNIPLDQANFRPDADLWPVYFAYDSYAIDNNETDTLVHNAGVLNQRSGYVQIAGHSDERGTQEYNLALGERRALAVREYLIRLGVDGSRIVTTSYGEEFPAAAGSNEQAWALNRRAETLISQ